MNLLKRLVVVCLAMSLLVGCGGKPRNISEDMYELGVKALEITEDYLATDLNVEEAYDKMSRISSQAVEDKSYSGDELIKLKIRTMQSSLALAKSNPKKHEAEQMKDLKEYKKSLAEKLGK